MGQNFFIPASVPESLCPPVSGLHQVSQGHHQRPLSSRLHRALQQGLPGRHGDRAGGRGAGCPGLYRGAVDRYCASLSEGKEFLVTEGHCVWTPVHSSVQTQEDLGEIIKVSRAEILEISENL